MASSAARKLDQATVDQMKIKVEHIFKCLPWGKKFCDENEIKLQIEKGRCAALLIPVEKLAVTVHSLLELLDNKDNRDDLVNGCGSALPVSSNRRSQSACSGCIRADTTGVGIVTQSTQTDCFNDEQQRPDVNGQRNGSLAATEPQEKPANIAKKRHEHGAPVKNLTPGFQPLNQPSPAGPADYITIEDHVWWFMQNKHSDFIHEFSRKYGGGLQRQVDFDDNGKRVKLKITASDERLLHEASEDIIARYSLIHQTPLIYRLEEIMEEDFNDVSDAVKRFDIVLLKGSYYHVIGESSSVEEAVKEMRKVISDKHARRGHDLNLNVEEAARSEKQPFAEQFRDSNEDLFSCSTPSAGIRVYVRKGDIVHAKTEAIVNPTDVRLQHKTGLARSVADAAGHVYRKECSDFVKEKLLSLSKPVAVTPGRIDQPTKFVIQVAVPDRSCSAYKHDDAGLRQCLRDAYYNCLCLANDELAVVSIAIPVITSDISGDLKHVSVQLAYEAVLNFDISVSFAKRKLQSIVFIDSDTETAEFIAAVFRSLHDNRVPDDTVSQSLTAAPQPHVLTSQPSSALTAPISYASVASKPPGLYQTSPSSADTQHEMFAAMQSPSKVGFNRSNSLEQQPPIGGMSDAGRHSASSGHQLDIPPGSAAGKRPRALKKDDCVICMDVMKSPKKLDCGHSFCQECIDEAFKKCQPKCPSCGKLHGVLRGNQPYGTMTKKVNKTSLPGYEKAGTIEITYTMPSGIQTDEHPNPGKPYTGTTRAGLLPDNQEGREVYKLLKRAFDAKLIFTVGRSVTTGKEDQVVWNDIHHKTKSTGPHGYPDPTYLKRVKEELAAKGIVP